MRQLLTGMPRDGVVAAVMAACKYVSTDMVFCCVSYRLPPIPVCPVPLITLVTIYANLGHLTAHILVEPGEGGRVNLKQLKACPQNKI